MLMLQKEDNIWIWFNCKQEKILIVPKDIEKPPTCLTGLVVVIFV